MSEIAATRPHPTERATVPTVDGNPIPRSDEKERVQRIAGHMAEVMRELKLDLGDPNFEQTPERVAKMYLEMFHGLFEGSEPKVTTFPNDEGYHHMVIEREIPFYSMCAHHFVPFYGHAHIAYIPDQQIVGLSKLPRILEFYAKRPQLQERLTEQVAEFLWSKLKPLGVMVVVEARHLCVEMRGVKKPGALTTTSALRGCFADRKVRQEFLALVRRQISW
jgi:GTP cyclohydrolase IA